MTHNISRRSLIAGSIAGTAAIAAPVFAKAAPAWDETVDVIVVGTGFAGLAAAIEAKKAGANVIVLEKMSFAGGNSAINGGILTATGCPQQKLHHIQDSVELLEKDILVAGQYLNNREKVHLMATQALPTYEWCVNTLGVEFLPDAIGQEGGHSVPRYVTTKNGSGSGIVMKELEYVKKLGVPVRTKTFVEHIVRDEMTGRVTGLVVREGYQFPKKGSGTVKRIAAKKGVVLCYGGFAADVKFRMYQDPKLNASLDTTNQPSATSELWRETSAIGCLQVQNDWIQCGPWGNPKEKGMGIGWQFNQTAAAEYGIWINSDGKRFVNELANRKVRADAIMLEQQEGKKAFAICNEPNVQPLKKQRPGFLEKMLDAKILDKYDTVEAMAKGSGIPLENLQKTIAAFNEAVKAKKDPVLGRYINNDQVPMVEGPWYIGECQPKVHHCMGGLYTDNDCRVIDVRTDQPIPGLFAAGEASGGVHGAVRLGSCATLDCLVFGRIAGRKAAA
ncbi:flavocytochrome c [uncultured Sutterella sp.]|uniref:flavocytochrome c n=1 Tax=uncultured Sutterella sp. TaxID=286133 RepID=UPI0025F58304|nr:flavocytochrome c [uncultured Sutterella sp.]